MPPKQKKMVKAAHSSTSVIVIAVTVESFAFLPFCPPGKVEPTFHSTSPITSPCPTNLEHCNQKKKQRKNTKQKKSQPSILLHPDLKSFFQLVNASIDFGGMDLSQVFSLPAPQ